MTITLSTLNERLKDGHPLYVAIAHALADAIHSGDLKPGSRLPTHRDLAGQLGVTVGTVSRAYLEVQRQGLVSGEVGRGTFVRPAQAPHESFANEVPPAPDTGLIDLRTNVPPFPDGQDLQALLSETLSNLARRPGMRTLFSHEIVTELPEHRQAGALWLQRCGLDANSDQVLITSGAQHGLTVVFATVAAPGDLIVADTLSNPGIKAVADLLHLEIAGLPADEHGLVPDAFADVCRTRKVRALYCAPTIHNPTAITMPEERRRAIVAIARTHGVVIVEDDEYGALPAGRPAPIARIAPDVTYYVASLSKSLGFGLRIAYVLPPRGMERRVLNQVRATTWMVSPLLAEIPSGWILDGTADRIVHGRREELAARQQVAAAVLAGFTYQSHPHASHVWLQLPGGWRSDRFALEAERRGVVVAAAEEFAVGPGQLPSAVRVALGAVPNRGLLRLGLERLVTLLHEGPGLSLV
jgi:DNA-binding transcriptional MocR family regulator